MRERICGIPTCLLDEEKGRREMARAQSECWPAAATVGLAHVPRHSPSPPRPACTPYFILLAPQKILDGSIAARWKEGRCLPERWISTRLSGAEVLRSDLDQASTTGPHGGRQHDHLRSRPDTSSSHLSTMSPPPQKMRHPAARLSTMPEGQGRVYLL